MNFKVGDVCEMHSLDDWREPYNGTECCIIGGLAERFGDTSKKTKLCYKVHCALDNGYWLVEPQYLRLKYLPPPTNFDLAIEDDWAGIGWRPTRVTA